jgi:hypothetical protein
MQRSEARRDCKGGIIFLLWLTGISHVGQYLQNYQQFKASQDVIGGESNGQ